MSLHKDIERADIIGKLQSGLEAGKYGIDNDTGKLFSVSARRNKDFLNWDTPWVFTNNPEGYSCDWMQDIFTAFGFVPRFCQSCWKVVVRPQTLQELMLLYELQKKMVEDNPECYCKCGIELRPFVFGNYGGYFYCRSRKIGLERYEQVRAGVDETISPDVPVTLKRACTEFELQAGPSCMYGVTDDQNYWEEVIEANCEITPYGGKQSPEAIVHIIRKWIKHAWSVGDKTVYLYTDGEQLITPPFTYHDKVDETEVGKAETGDADTPDQSEPMTVTI